MTHICVYHSHCPDGITAAWVIARKFPGIELYEGSYDQPPDLERLRDKHVIMVDFSWKRDAMCDVASVALTILVLDHHKTAEAELVPGKVQYGDAVMQFKPVEEYFVEISNWDTPSGVVLTQFDMARSGAGLAWDFFFFPHESRPDFINYVEDRDLWKFKHPQTKSFYNGMALVPLTPEDRFPAYDKLRDGEGIPEVLQQGVAIEAYRQRLISDIMHYAHPATVLGHKGVWVCNSPVLDLISDLGEVLALKGGPFGLVYWHKPDGKIQLSLRSRGEFDVSEIAKQLGGGGHKNASGATIVVEDYFDVISEELAD